MPLPPDSSVDFIIIGAAKCATTWLQHSLTRTPEIHMPGPELHFFSRQYDRGISWYTDQFDVSRDTVKIGEKSNSYLTEPQAAERIRDHYPDARLILQMRDPVKRAYSDYCMLFRRGEVSSRIDDYLDPNCAADGRFLSDGRYTHHLTRFYDIFPADQILLLAYEDVRHDPNTHLQKVGAHIGFEGRLDPIVQRRVKDKNTPMVPLPLRRMVSPMRSVLDPVRHTWPVRSLRNAIARKIEYPTLSDDLIKKMSDFYAPDIELLRHFDPELCKLWSTALPTAVERIA